VIEIFKLEIVMSDQAYVPHSFAEMFPPMTAKEREELEKSLKQYGLRDKILVDNQNRILDGLNRYRGCLAVGVKPEYEVFQGTEEEAHALIWDRNVVRRHLSTSVRAALAADYSELKRGQRKSGNFQISAADAAEKFKVSESSVNIAKAIKRASPELYGAVKTNSVSVNVAEAIAKLPDKERSEVVRRVKDSPTKKQARIIAKAAIASAKSASRAAPPARQQPNFHAAYAALFQELDQLPQMLVAHPLSSDLIESLTRALQGALDRVTSRPCEFASARQPAEATNG
jgi:hypothetical protein